MNKICVYIEIDNSQNKLILFDLRLLIVLISG